MRVLSIQSSVVYGYVGNSVAAFALQRLGHEVLAIPTVVLSNHTGYPTARGPALGAEHLGDVVAGVEERGAFAECDAVLSGYLGGADVGKAVLDAVTRVREANPRAAYVCDPVLGDADSGCYVRPEVVDLVIDELVPAADVVTPNQYELGLLAGSTPESVDDVLAAADTVRATGPGVVLVTSVALSEDAIGVLAVDGSGAWLVETPRLDTPASGAGDLTAALFTAHLGRAGSVADALVRTASAAYAVVAATHAAGAAELRLIEAQDALVDPPEQLEIRRIR